jgi:beta-lactamase regulating signal transducer with metallopeptidase domain
VSAAWIVYVVVVGTLLAVAAKAAASAAAGAGLPTRWAWSAALAGVVALAAIAPSTPAMRIPASLDAMATAATPAARTDARSSVGRMIDASREAVRSARLATLALLERRVPIGSARVAVMEWATTSTVLLALFVAVNRRLARARRRWPTHTLRGDVVRVAPATGPAVLGLLRPEIVVPRSLLTLGDDEQRLILAHEREHLKARDHLLLAGAWLVAIGLPWHPAVWYLVAQLRLAIELDCDARVLRAGVPRTSYGSLLIDMAARRDGFRIGALALADGRSHLERRILAMNGSRKRHAALSGAAFGTLSVLLVLAACEAKVPTASEIASMDVASAQRSASEAGYLRTPANARTDFFVDGKQVSAEQARALQAKEIGSIEVVKSELPTGRDTIIVTTTARMPKSILSLRASAPSTMLDWNNPPGGEGPDPLEVGETTFERKVTASDSSEHMVAHVADELARSRAWTKAGDGASASAMTEKVRERSSEAGTKVRGGPPPLLLIDGRRSSEAALAALDTKDIASIQVYKGGDGAKVFRDPAAANGVIVVTTRAAKK